MTEKIIDKIKGGDTTIYLRKSKKNWIINTWYSRAFQTFAGQAFVGAVIDELNRRYEK